MDFKSFKKGRSKLQKSVSKMKDQNPKFKKDERFWTPTKDDAGSSNALIRFLPQPDIEKPPTISFFQHGFKEKGKWFIDNCPSTFSDPCPVCEHIEPYWDEDTEESKNYARRYSRTKQFICNILVIKDLVKPENNGKVFLFKFGIKIYEKIEEKIFPESELDEAIQIFDPWEGCAFKLKLRQKSGRNNYDQSQFNETVGPVCKSDKDLEVIFNAMHDLDEFLDKKKFPAYDKMAKKFCRIMKIDVPSAAGKATVASDEKGDALLDEFEDGPDKAKSAAKESKSEPDDLPNTDTGDEDDFDFEDDTKEPDKEPDKKATKEPAAEVKEEAKASETKEDDDFNFDDDDDDFNFEDE